MRKRVCVLLMLMLSDDKKQPPTHTTAYIWWHTNLHYINKTKYAQTQHKTFISKQQQKRSVVPPSAPIEVYTGVVTTQNIYIYISRDKKERKGKKCIIFTRVLLLLCRIERKFKLLARQHTSRSVFVGQLRVWWWTTPTPPLGRKIENHSSWWWFIESIQPPRMGENDDAAAIGHRWSHAWPLALDC